MLVQNLVEIGPVVIKKKILKVGQCIFAILLLSPLAKGHGPSFEQTLPKHALCQVWLKLALWFFKILQCMFAISLLSPLEKGRGPLLK